MTEKQKKMILDWMRKIHQLEYAHRFASLQWNLAHKIIGIGAFTISLLIAASYRFPEVESSTFNKIPVFLHHDYFVAIFSGIVAILTSLQTFLKPSEKSDIHKNTGSSYEKLRHRIELILTMEYEELEFKQRTEAIKDEWENLDAINVSNRNFKAGKNKVKSFNKYPKELDFLDDVSN